MLTLKSDRSKIQAEQEDLFEAMGAKVAAAESIDDQLALLNAQGEKPAKPSLRLLEFPCHDHADSITAATHTLPLSDSLASRQRNRASNLQRQRAEKAKETLKIWDELLEVDLSLPSQPLSSKFALPSCLSLILDFACATDHYTPT